MGSLMIQNHSVLEIIDKWVAHGWLNQLNRAFVRFLLNQEKNASDPVLLAAALVSHQLDKGEVYLDLEKLCQQPELLLAISASDSQITDSDFVLDELPALKIYDLEQWISTLKQSRLVSTGKHNTPLVLDGKRLYLRRYWQYQQTLNICIQQRLRPMRNSLPAALLDQLACLFPSTSEKTDWQKIACVLALRSRFTIITGGPGTGKTTTLSKLLALLIKLAHQSSKHARNPEILLAAPTGKAAARVSESISKAVDNLNISEQIKQAIPKKAITLHRLLGSRHDSRQFFHNRHKPVVADIVIVDEASMIDLEMMASLLEALPDTTQLILLGDKDQLASVEAGSVMGDLCQGAEQAAYDKETLSWISQYSGQSLPINSEKGSAINQQTVMLRHSHRFNEHSGIGQLAKAVNAGDVRTTLNILNDIDKYSDLIPLPARDYLKLRASSNPDDTLNLLKKLVTNNAGADDNGKAKPCQGYGYYLDIIKKNRPVETAHYNLWARQVLSAFDSFQVLSALRQGSWGIEELNQRIEAWLFPTQKQNIWYEGRPVMITRNDYNLGLMNGDIGITLKDNTGKLRVVFPGDNPLTDSKVDWISPMRLPDAETAFSITVHKAQGSEFNHVALVLPEIRSPVITRELIYTGITRAKENFTLLDCNTAVFTQAVLATCKK